MLSTFLILRNTIKLSLVGFSLIACNLIDKPNFFKDESWQDLGCDTTRKVTQLSVYDVVQPFYGTDTLLRQNLNLTAGKIFVAVTNLQGGMEVAGLKISEEEKPSALSLHNSQSLILSWQDEMMIESLLKEPRYLYDKWELLLSGDRETFLAKRDSVLDEMKAKKLNIKVISDLRSMANQKKYLGRNRTSAPVSMHNFGLAADFAIVRRGRISNNLALYKPLDALTQKYGLTWGGNFVGFIDSGHIQFYKNGAELLKKYPELSFEFELYRPYYLNSTRKMIEAGKEDKIEDTKELLSQLNAIRKDRPCTCQVQNVVIPASLIASVELKLIPSDYVKNTDVLIIGDVVSQTVSMVTANGVITYPLGLWK